MKILRSFLPGVTFSLILVFTYGFSSRTNHTSEESCFNMRPEPVYTNGNSNSVFLEQRNPEIKQFEISVDLQNWHSFSITTDSCWTAKTWNDDDDPLQHGVRYYYRTSFTNLSCFSDTVSSIQDARPPQVAVPAALSLPACTSEREFYVKFAAWDTTCGSVDLATLYYRTQPGTPWQPYESKALDKTQAATSFETALVDSFLFQTPQDGYFEFYVGARDTARAPEAQPGSSLTDRDGNEDIPNPESQPHDSIFVDTLIPMVVDVAPDSGSFNLADDLTIITIEFNRLVRPLNGWSQAIVVSNAYDNGADVSFAAQPNDTAAVQTLILELTARQSASYQIGVDGDQIASADSRCEVLSGENLTWSFFTFMEAEQGGSVLTEAVDVVVPPGAPSQNIVIQFDSAGVGPCAYKGYTPLNVPATMIAAYASEDVLANIAVPATLSLSYRGASNGLDPATLRIFEQSSDGCRPAGDPNSWMVDQDAQKVRATVTDAIGVFFIARPTGEPPDQALGNYPNPFTESTTITYFLENTGANLNLRIYDQFGNLVRNFDPAVLPSNLGLNEHTWDGKNDVGETVATGGYIAVLRVGNERFQRKIGVVR